MTHLNPGLWHNCGYPEVPPCEVCGQPAAGLVTDCRGYLGLTVNIRQGTATPQHQIITVHPLCEEHGREGVYEMPGEMMTKGSAEVSADLLATV